MSIREKIAGHAFKCCKIVCYKLHVFSLINPCQMSRRAILCTRLILVNLIRQKKKLALQNEVQFWHKYVVKQNLNEMSMHFAICI